MTSITVTHDGQSYIVPVEISYPNGGEGIINATIKAFVSGQELIFRPTKLGGLEVLPEEHGLDRDLVNKIAWKVLKGI